MCSRLFDYQQYQRRLETRLLTVARSNIVYDGALVGVGPGVPVEGQLRSGSDVGVEPSGSRALVAVDVVSAQGSRLDESKILVQGIPARCLWSRVRWGVVPYWVGALGPDVVGSDTTNKA